MNPQNENWTRINQSILFSKDSPFQVGEEPTVESRDKPTRSRVELEKLYSELNDEQKYGLDDNGIFFKHEIIISIEEDERGKNDSEIEVTRTDGSNEKIHLDLRNSVLKWSIGSKEVKFCLKRCPCGGKIVKITGENAHMIMDGGSGSTTASRSTRGLSRINGLGRNYLSPLFESGSGSGLDSLSYLIQLDRYNFGNKKSKIIAVIDTGLDLFLSSNKSDDSIKLWENPGKTCENLCGDRFGYNFVDDNENVFDDHGHGTEVTSVFAENFGWGNNYRIMVLKAFDAQGHGGSYETACAIYYAIRHHADIIIASWGSPHFDPNVYLALKAAQERKIVTFAACGNFGEDISKRATPFYPALHGFEGVDKDLKLKNLYPIGATEQHKKQPADLWSDSNYHDLVLATDGEDINVVTCSYSNAVPDTSVPFNFNYLSSILPVVINGTVVKLDYYTKVVSGTSFATPRAAAMYLANDYALNAETKPSNAKGVKFRDLD